MISSSASFVARMKDAEVLDTEVLVDKQKRFVRQILRMPDGVEIDWYFVDTTPSVMVVPITESGTVLLVKQYRHNLKRDTLELPAGITEPGEPVADAALRELEEETGHTISHGSRLTPLSAFYSLPSETNKYIHFFLANPVVRLGQAKGDTEIEKYFDMSLVEMPFEEAISSIGKTIFGLETVGGLLLAREVMAADTAETSSV